MAIIKSSVTEDHLSVDPTSNAGRVTTYHSDGKEIALSGRRGDMRGYRAQDGTFCTTFVDFNPASNPQDMVIITGSDTKVIRVLSMKFGTSNATVFSQAVYLVKRNTLNDGGTFVDVKATRMDSSNEPATAKVGHYTADATTLGNLIGNINIMRVQMSDTVGVTWGKLLMQTPHELLPWIDGSVKPITLRGSEEMVAINYNGATTNAAELNLYQIIWVEENP